jgi:superfamily II helicase
MCVLLGWLFYGRLLEEDSLSQLGTVVVDELHLIGDQGRGTLLELILTKIKYMVAGSAQRAADNSLLSAAEGNKTHIQVFVSN